MSASESIPPPTRDPVPTCLMVTLKRRGAMKSKLSLFALAVLLLAAPARADQLWTWTGDCVTNSAGRLPVPPCHTATFQAITLDSYVPGTVFDALGTPHPITTLVSASYHDDAGGSLTISQQFFDSNGTNFKFPASSGEADGFINTQTSFFRSFADRPGGHRTGRPRSVRMAPLAIPPSDSHRHLRTNDRGQRDDRPASA